MKRQIAKKEKVQLFPRNETALEYWTRVETLNKTFKPKQRWIHFLKPLELSHVAVCGKAYPGTRLSPDYTKVTCPRCLSLIKTK